MQAHWIAVLALVPIAQGAVFPVPAQIKNGKGGATFFPFGHVTGRDIAMRADKKKHQRSTSSSSGERIGSASGDSLGIQESSEDYNEEGNKHKYGDLQGCDIRNRRLTGTSGRKRRKKRRRKWHRRCTPCPRDMIKKWRDPSITWICGGYQRARRSFKSECMMHYRNCQDGTMFVKLSDYRCDDKAPGYNGGKHFFYDYNVELPDDSTSKESEESSEDSFSDSSDTE